MRAIFLRDFRAYFTSPLGYVYISACLFVMNLVFLLHNVNARSSDLSFTYWIMLVVLMFTTPLLTMRLFSEEYKQKTDQLLLTAPVKVFQIVMGKFWAALSVFGCVLGFTLVWPILIALHGTPNMAGVVGNIVALLFVASAFLSIGLFMSSLTENQLISALSTMGLLLALFLLDMYAVGLKTGWLYWVGQAVRQISLYQRFDIFTRGIFSLSDIVFYLSVCAFFLFLTARMLEKKRWA